MSRCIKKQIVMPKCRKLRQFEIIATIKFQLSRGLLNISQAANVAKYYLMQVVKKYFLYEISLQMTGLFFT
jgi:hypothetical protein